MCEKDRRFNNKIVQALDWGELIGNANSKVTVSARTHASTHSSNTKSICRRNGGIRELTSGFPVFPHVKENYSQRHLQSTSILLACEQMMLHCQFCGFLKYQTQQECLMKFFFFLKGGDL